ncbi:MAG: peptide MFS transporter [Burkholderiales bacterium]|nr:peptide MFS transporter [Burkholderiales bacterium]
MSLTMWRNHPSSLKRLFFTEMWERFSFYGLNAVLVLFLTKSAHIPENLALIIFGSYVTYVYLATTIAGFLADRIYGYAKVAFMGGIFILLGHLSLALSVIDFKIFYLGLGFIATGTGLLKPNVSIMVGKLYTDSEEDKRVQGFNIYYMGINIGAVIAPLSVGFVAEKISWHAGFGLAAIGMTLGLVIFKRGMKNFPSNCKIENTILRNSKFSGIKLDYIVYIGLLILAVVFASLLANPIQSTIVSGICLIILGGYIVLLWRKLSTEERSKVWIILVLSIFSVSYWTLSNQTIASLPIFIDRVVDLNYFGMKIPASSISSFYSLILITLAPVIAWFWGFTKKIQHEPGYAGKFAIGLTMATLAFVFIILGIIEASHMGKMNLLWILACYTLLGFGELCISPNGLALVTKYAPQSMSGVMMGLWWMINAFAGLTAGLLAQLIGFENTEHLATEQQLSIYQNGFIKVSIIGIIITGILFIIRKNIDRKG